MFESGAADQVADALISVVGGMGPTGLLIGLFVVTAVFGQLISNTATALIVIPIGAAAAAETGYDLRPVLMSICVAASAALLTPVATPVNLIAMGAAGYRFGDYWRLGLAVMVVFFVVAVFVVPIVWPFT
jgi:di/tricarboxylate transporter